MLHFLFPVGSTPNAPDEMFVDQSTALIVAGFSVSLYSDAAIVGGQALRNLPTDSTVVLRGWMLTADEYRTFVRAVEKGGAKPLVNLDAYSTTHHLPNWYPLLADLTPETRVYPEAVDIAAELRALDWGTYFLKDYVKSLKIDRGPIVRDPAEAPALIAEMREYRGRIGGARYLPPTQTSLHNRVTATRRYSGAERVCFLHQQRITVHQRPV